MSDKALIEAAIAVVDGWSKQRFDSRSALMCQCIDALHRAAIAAAQAEQITTSQAPASATSVQLVAWMRPVRSIINLTDPPVYGPVRYVACDKDDESSFPVYASAPTPAQGE